MNSNPTGLNGMAALKSRAIGPEAQSRSRTLLLAATVITLILQFLPYPYGNLVTYPLRLFVTFIHESGHAMAALLTGGQVDSVTIHSDGSGVTWTHTLPWSGWLVKSGGYLGTTLFGALLLQVGRLSRWQNAGRVTLFAAAGFLLTVTLLWGHSDLFTLVTGVALAGLLWFLARICTPQAANFIASFLAVQCCLNALIDLRILLDLTTKYPGQDNDAVFMQQQYLLPAAFWAALWAVMAVIILALALRSYWRGTAVRTEQALARTV